MAERGALANVSVVVIGRNEGQRLRNCLESIRGVGCGALYVDSGSTDGSAELARATGVGVLELDMSVPFTAARARNAGFRQSQEEGARTAYVQFVDADCELAEGWLLEAASFLDANPRVATVCGRLREKYPERSVYNMLCDIEWQAPAGEARACGGIAMIRAAAFESVGGFRADLIAGEEPELCVRLRAAGWRIHRLGGEMALHDAGMSRFGQWWTRTLRTGYAFAQAVHLHGAAPERHGVRESASAWLWGLAIPAAVLGVAWMWGGWALALLLVYPLQIVRLALRGGLTPGQNWRRAGFLMLGKFPEVLGQMKFLFHRYLSGHSRLIEYK